MKIIIIGSIAAGVSAAARLAAAQRGAQITVYEKGGFYSCGTGGLPHYLCEDLDSLNKAIQAKETELNAQGITAHLRHEVRGIDAAARKVTVCDFATGRVFEDHYDKLVLATGSSNRVPQVPGSPFGRKFVDHTGNRLLISRNRIRTEDNRIVWLYRHFSVHVRRHSRQSRHRLSLTSGCDKNHFLRRIILHLIDLDQCVFRHIQISQF